MDWMKIAVTLPVGHSKRINCWKCGGKKSGSISNRGKFYYYGCFKCKDNESQDMPDMTPAERLKLKRDAEKFEASDPTIPDDFTLDIPIAGLLWLSKGGLHVDEIRKYGFGWSETMRRVILPVYRDMVLQAVQARSVSDDVHPKYLGQVWSGYRPVFRSSGTGTGKTLVLTEDILSACRVGKVCPAWSLLGTNLHHHTITEIANSQYDDIVIWMDDDEAGINARRKMLVQLNSVGINARGLISDRDPKHHTLEEMKELIYGNLS